MPARPYLLVSTPVCEEGTVTNARYKQMASRQVTGREAEAAEDAISSHWTLVIVSWISHSLPPRPAGLGFVQARFLVSQILWLAGEGIPPPEALHGGISFLLPISHVCADPGFWILLGGPSLAAHAKSPG